MEDPQTSWAETQGSAQDQRTVNAGEAINFFIDNGFNSKMANAMVATLQSISGLRPTQTGNGFGIGGWQGARYARFERYCQRLLPSKSPYSGDVQLMYVMNEMHTTHKIAYGKLIRAQEIDGTEYGEKEDGIPIKTGMMAIFKKYYIDNNTRFDENSATRDCEWYVQWKWSIMTSVNLQELNNFIHNMYTDVGVNEKEGPGASIQQYLIDNLSNIGRYSHRDFERFGNYVSQEGDADHFDQAGWMGRTDRRSALD